MRIKAVGILALCGVLAASPALAAIVTPGQGTVYVSVNGGGYQPVSAPGDFPPGTLVMVSPGSTANMTYPDGCAVPIQPGEVFTIQTVSPCVGPNQPPPSTAQNTDSAWVWVAGGLAAAALGVGIYYAVSNNSSSVSP